MSEESVRAGHEVPLLPCFLCFAPREMVDFSADNRITQRLSQIFPVGKEKREINWPVVLTFDFYSPPR